MLCAFPFILNVFGWRKMNKNFNAKEQVRAIKFRAWDKNLEIMSRIIKIRDMGVVNKEEIIMQFTGLKDKNKKEIFEGDIVEFKGCISIVEFRKDIGAFITRLKSGLECYNFWEYDSSKFEVIGNIYENPGLLEETK